MINNKHSNAGIVDTIDQMAQWHKERNLIAGTSSRVQIVKGFEEMIEVYMALNPHYTAEHAVDKLHEMIDTLHSNGRIKADPYAMGLADGIGDVNVVLLNIAEREGYTMAQCFSEAYEDIKDRKGKMVNGSYVKESDLPE